MSVLRVFQYAILILILLVMKIAVIAMWFTMKNKVSKKYFIGFRSNILQFD